ncbi:hypothetical protein B4144_3152 [Bacillus atrophaeus]|nr:hypothetical protein B4144_3152 [Bacillus atrophaeus]
MSTDSEKETFRKLAAEFAQEFDSIRVKIHFPGNDYENMMDVRVAANDLKITLHLQHHSHCFKGMSLKSSSNSIKKR